MSTITDATQSVKRPRVFAQSSKKKMPRWKKLVISHGSFLLAGTVIANVSLANHPEWTPCCATLNKSTITQNLTEAAASAKKEQAELTARLATINKAAEANK